MPNIDENLAFAPSHKLATMIADKQVSPVEVTQMYFDRIERLDSQLNSYLTLTHDDAMESAKAAEDAVVRGDELGPLHGVPISIKDLGDDEGYPHDLGFSRLQKPHTGTADSAVAERVKASGAVLLGKTNTPEFGSLGANENRLGDDCRNPWNTERTSGASSGGAGAAVAAGLCSLGTGSDGGGSIRIPASFCGIYGIKPTQGRVSGFSGVPQDVPLVNLLGQNGPMTRTVKDSAILLQALSGYDSRDASSLHAPVPDFVAAVDKDVSGLRLGWSSDFGYAGVDAEVVEVCAEGARVFEGLGCSVDESNLTLDDPFEIWWVISGCNSYITQGHLLDDPSDPLTWYGKMLIEDGKEFTAADYVKALGRRDRMINQFADVFDDYDLLLSPTMATTAFPVGDYPEVIEGKRNAHVKGWGFLPFTHPINMIGHPAATVPCGFSSDGLPIGLHIVGRKGDEEAVLAASAAFERAMPWAGKRPAVS